MPKITMEKTELYDLIKRAVREVLEEELFKQRLEQIALVSGEEMREIGNRMDDHLLGRRPLE